LRLKRRLFAGLRWALKVGVRLRPNPAPAPGGGTVVLLDRCLGLGDVLMVSPTLRLLEPLGPVTVVSALPPLLDWPGPWIQARSWAAMRAEAARLCAGGGELLMPRLGLRGCWSLLTWPGGVPSGVIWLDAATWLDTGTGATGPITGRHYTDGALACARTLVRRTTGAEPGDTPPRIPPRTDPAGLEAAAGAELPPGPLVALAPWATSRIRRWPPGHWHRLVGLLARARPELGFVLLGSAEERPAGEEIVAGQTARLVNLMGRLSLPATAALMARAAVLVACDNGLMHFGLGVGVPVVALFGSTDPSARLAGNRWSLAHEPGLCPGGLAPCYPDLHRDPPCPTAIECLAGLTPERVAALVLGWLAGDDEGESACRS
jgi:hypothetical protein